VASILLLLFIGVAGGAFVTAVTAFANKRAAQMHLNSLAEDRQYEQFQEYKVKVDTASNVFQYSIIVAIIFLALIIFTYVQAGNSQGYPQLGGISSPVGETPSGDQPPLPPSPPPEESRRFEPRFAFTSGIYSGWGIVDNNARFIPHGEGTKVWADGETRFEGEFRYGEMHHGRKTFPSGDVYFGYFLNERMHGAEGYYEWVDGRRYVGAFRDGYRHGFGHFYNWVGEMLTSHEQWIGTYRGYSVDGIFEGYGEFEFAGGYMEKFVGEFRDNRAWSGDITLRNGAIIKIYDGRQVP